MLRQYAETGDRRIAGELKHWLTLLEQRHPRAIDLGLERCGAVYRKLGSPRPAKTVFTVAGTNGKGSTVAYLAAMAIAHGKRCGTYTSPHIIKFNERISVMGESVPDEVLVQAFEQVELARGDVSLTYFEFTSLAAFIILQQSDLDCAVLEVGLGGRLDTVNLIDTDCAVITPIGLDHQDFLGHDLASIATEKAGIIRAGKPVVCTQAQPPEPILKAASELGAPLFRRGIDFDLLAVDEGCLRFSMSEKTMDVPPPPMGGSHQLDNLAAALAAFVLVHPTVADDAVAEAVGNCSLPGRMQQVAHSPDIFLDVGHNAHAAEAVATYFSDRGKMNVICVLAMFADKPAEAVARALGRVCSRWLCAGTGGQRGQTGRVLASRLGSVLQDAAVGHFESLDDAMAHAWSVAGDQDTILVFGSFSTVADVMKWLENNMQGNGQ